MSAAGAYTVEYDPKTLKELTTLDRPGRRCVVRRTATSWHPTFAGYPDLWRIRVGDHRVICTIKDAELVVFAVRVAHDSSVYRRL